jgi:hypothetical protein
MPLWFRVGFRLLSQRVSAAMMAAIGAAGGGPLARALAAGAATCADLSRNAILRPAEETT